MTTLDDGLARLAEALDGASAETTPDRATRETVLSPETGLSRAWRLLAMRPALVAGLAVALPAFLLLLLPLPPSTAPLAAWDLGVLAYLAVSARLMSADDPATMRHRARRLDEGRWPMLLFTVGAAAASLAAILVEMAMASGEAHAGLRHGLAAATVALSWIFLHVAFAQHYANVWWEVETGLAFPGDCPRPGYWDFVYVAFAVATTFGTTDVQVTTTGMRRLVALHGMVAFVFNCVILAVAINLASDAAR